MWFLTYVVLLEGSSLKPGHGDGFPFVITTEVQACLSAGPTELWDSV